MLMVISRYSKLKMQSILLIWLKLNFLNQDLYLICVRISIIRAIFLKIEPLEEESLFVTMYQ